MKKTGDSAIRSEVTIVAAFMAGLYLHDCRAVNLSVPVADFTWTSLDSFPRRRYFHRALWVLGRENEAASPVNLYNGVGLGRRPVLDQGSGIREPVLSALHGKAEGHAVHREKSAENRKDG